MAKNTVAAPRKRRSARRADSGEIPSLLPHTARVVFRAVPAENRHLLSVLEGVEITTAYREAADLEDAVRRLLAGSIESGMDGSAAYLCDFALETARALRIAGE